MKIAYFDCFAGASGDMIVGSLLDAGVQLAAIQSELAALDLDGYRLEVRQVNRRGVTATKVDVIVGERLADSDFPEVSPGHDHAHDHDHGHTHLHSHTHAHTHTNEHAHEHRPLRAILDLLDASRLTPDVRERAKRIFLRLGRAESRVHGIPLDEVHFHEVGSTDAIVDIVMAAAGLHLLGADRILVSPLHVGSGFVRTAHGLYPVPAPATANLLEGVPVYSTEIRGELVTPTGAAILTEAATEYGPLPAMTVTHTGYGAGTRERELPNVVRLIVGEATDRWSTESVIELAANIDDMNPQFYDHLMQRLLSDGALDVWLTPVHMKKNRPGTILHVLCRPADADRLTALILTESTTIGVRRQVLERVALEREMETVATPWGSVRVKVALQQGRPVNAMPEYDDCAALAEQTGVPLKTIHAAAVGAAEALMRRQLKTSI